MDNVNFSVSESSIFGLLGPSGAGKTTIIKLLTGQLTADSGSASLFNTNSAQLTKAEYARIGMVLDESGVYKRLTVADNLAMFADIYGIGKQKITVTLEVELNNNQASADKIAALLKQENIRTIHSTEPDLEAVFIELTGRKLA